MPCVWFYNQRALDHEGWVVGVAVLWGYIPSKNVEKGFCY